MRKVLIASILALILLAVGAATALASDNPNPPSNETSQDLALKAGPKAWMGLVVRNLKKDEAAAHGLEGAVLVIKVMAEGPGAKAGVEPNDIITAVDGKPVTSIKSLFEVLSASQSGATVAVSLLRGTDELTLNIVLAERPVQPKRPQTEGLPFKHLIPFGHLGGRIISGNITFEGKDGILVTLSIMKGTVVSVQDNTLRIDPADDSPEFDITVTDTVKVVGGGAKGLSKVQQGDTILVVKQGTELKAIIVGPFHKARIPHPKLHKEVAPGGHIGRPSISRPAPFRDSQLRQRIQQPATAQGYENLSRTH